MEEPSGLDDSGEGTLEHPRSHRGHPLPPPRHESYHLKLIDGYIQAYLSLLTVNHFYIFIIICNNYHIYSRVLFVNYVNFHLQNQKL